MDRVSAMGCARRVVRIEPPLLRVSLCGIRRGGRGVVGKKGELAYSLLRQAVGCDGIVILVRPWWAEVTSQVKCL